MAGLLEVDEQTGTPLATRTLYAFNGAVIAERNSADGSLVYLHGDHLGSVTAATTASGGVASRQEFDPWGAVRSGSVVGGRAAARGVRRGCACRRCLVRGRAKGWTLCRRAWKC
jgi:hypothetical protein